MDTGEPLQFDAVPVPVPPDAPLAVELIPAPSPWAVARKLSHLPHLLFLDSAEEHTERGRYSYVAADPRVTLLTQPPAGGETNGNEGESGTPFDPLERAKLRLRQCALTTVSDLPPFQGGLAGCFGYGYGRSLERLPQTRYDEFRVPDVVLGFYDWVFSYDHTSRRAWLVSSGFPFAPGDRSQRVERAAARLQEALQVLRTDQSERASHLPRLGERIDPAPQYALPGFPGVTSNFDRAGYEDAVRRAVEYIHAGDCFQVNLSQRLLAPLREHPLELYGRLRRLNPAPFGGYFDLGDYQLLSASPERFLRVHADGAVETRPIKGTRRRGRTPEEDAALVRDLVTSPKDRAENVMIVDLLRNDIGKVSVFGSVRVPRVCELETFRFVHHLVSEVRGKLKPEVGPLDLLTASFPGGSVTGAPKVRAMEIIAELEPTARGPYCGCLGWVGFDGAMDTNILIRTFTAGGGWVQFPVGGGIVADSDPAREYEETLHKAAGLLRSL
ncbi:Aminodeoxychorismate synthase component 1 [Gemmata obscuriglobus]|uniref:aminodeoxychorismate synthase n=1 Tax=Gemmata obscuriglobus TaxID=114 RepID=A0A2Z3HA07_9BACT|nr:aminodeoxychorismate synthase component I [Gemmata obscuriglobus]AWM38514.1 aminodeoxychorismate synthase, component I [Gemmata obscuriglobus]QEG28535.1 Aminodeoxychorismate synthase component 1 [Gemmata obscuriglobus]VTS06616.1 para-aminobenzoate synthase : Para-aminobenzoate synthase component I OS=Planctomyces maris DSM 8797 GN=PM8797T_00312 PE=4 SV=1: Anth_synt_I_N: Chorismate_bind [Gemmata obscuriglobus UQM 2246]